MEQNIVIAACFSHLLIFEEVWMEIVDENKQSMRGITNVDATLFVKSEASTSNSSMSTLFTTRTLITRVSSIREMSTRVP